MKNQHLLQEGRYEALCDQIRTEEATFDNFLGKKDDYEKLSKDPVFSRIVIDTIAENGHKYFGKLERGIEFECMMYVSADIIKENPDLAQNITPLLHNIKNTPPTIGGNISGLRHLAKTLTDIVHDKQESLGLARENVSKNAILIMENLSQIRSQPDSFIGLANKITAQGSGFTTEEKEAMDKIYLNVRKDNLSYIDRYISSYSDVGKSALEGDKIYMDNYISRKTERMQQRLKAEAQANGIIYEQITPEKNNKLNEPVSDKLLNEPAILSEEDNAYTDNYISLKKLRIRRRKQHSKVIKKINGIKYEQITPEKDDKLKEHILKKMLENKLKKR